MLNKQPGRSHAVYGYEGAARREVCRSRKLKKLRAMLDGEGMLSGAL